MRIQKSQRPGLLLLLAPLARAFYLPGVKPTDYSIHDPVDLSVNALSSSESLLPYDAYYDRLHFCEPDELEPQREMLGSILFGDRLFNSKFELFMLDNVQCKELCTKVIPKNDAKFINDRIKEGYSHNWFVDGLPAAEPTPDDPDLFNIGFRLGRFENGVAHLNNHFKIELAYHTPDQINYRIVAVTVQPFSVAPDQTNRACHHKSGVPEFSSLILSDDKDTNMTYSYTVTWKSSSVSWGTRWDRYLETPDAQIHWFSIINSIVIVLMLTGMIAMILLRALHKDISRYNSFADEDGGQEDFGWKLVHADVFRPPAQRMLLAVLLGNGAQLAAMTTTTLVFAALGFLSPSIRGALSTVTLIFFVCFSSIAGYVSARVYKMLQGEYWRRNVALTVTLVPGAVFIIFIVLNFFLVGANSSGAVPFGTMTALIVLWFVVSLPLGAVGAYLGFKAPAIEHPVKTNQIPRQIPPQPLYLNKWISALIGGILPFGAIFIELNFIMKSIWSHSVYYVFGFLFLVFAILVITCSEVSVLMCYFHMCSEDYYWAWRAFMTAGASGFYIFLYSIIYFIR
ncbi:hypothetical protein BDK51DRAFT_24443, partial [Blyttiomyces helicus]